MFCGRVAMPATPALPCLLADVRRVSARAAARCSFGRFERAATRMFDDAPSKKLISPTTAPRRSVARVRVRFGLVWVAPATPRCDTTRKPLSRMCIARTVSPSPMSTSPGMSVVVGSDLASCVNTVRNAEPVGLSAKPSPASGGTQSRSTSAVVRSASATAMHMSVADALAAIVASRTARSMVAVAAIAASRAICSTGAGFVAAW